MVKDIAALRSLEQALDTLFLEYETKRHVFNEFPKFDIDTFFNLWDEYLEFLERNKEEEYRERVRRAKLRKKEILPHVHMGGGYIDRVSSEYRPFWDTLLEKRHIVFGEGYCSKAEVKNLVEKVFAEQNLTAFFRHDIYHLHEGLTRQFWSVLYPRGDSSVNRMRDHREEILRFLELYNREPEFLFGNILEPYKMLHFITTTKLGKQPKKDVIKPSSLAFQTALTLQNRWPEAEYSLTDRVSDSTTNEIVVDSEDFSVNGNSGVVFSIIYNLAKNSYKKLGGAADNSQKIFIQVYDSPLSCYVVTVGDSGKPIDIGLMKEKTRQLILEKGIENVAFPSSSLRNKFQMWKENEYQVGKLTHKDLTDIAYMGRMSGFEIPDEFSSGMGLYGVKYLLDNMGGRILYGEDFQNGTPIFTCVLPKDLPSNRLRQTQNSLAAWVNQTIMYREGRSKLADCA